MQFLMPHVIRYNAIKPRKHALFPKYEHFVADERYAHIASMLGLPASSTAEGVESLVQAIIELGKSLNINMSIAEQGVAKEQFEAVVDI